MIGIIPAIILFALGVSLGALGVLSYQLDRDINARLRHLDRMKGAK